MSNISNLGLNPTDANDDPSTRVTEITQQMKALQELSKRLDDQLSSMEHLGDDEEEIFDVDIEDDDEIIEVGSSTDLPLPIVANISPKKEPVETPDEALGLGEDLGIETKDSPAENDDSLMDDSDLCEQNLYVGHRMDEVSGNNEDSDDKFNVDVKDEKIDITDLQMPGAWTVKYSKGRFDGKLLYTSPDGRYFHSVQQSLEYMIEKDALKEDVEIMKANLKVEGWKEVDYLPPSWLLRYYKPSNGYLYLSPDCRLFRSAKAVTDFMKKNHYSSKMINDVKIEMTESKKFNSKLKFKWQTGEHLPSGWKIRKQKGKGRHSTDVEYILSEDGVQFKSRFEGLQYLISKNYCDEDIAEMRKHLIASSERWKESSLLPSGWLYRFKGENPSSTSITYFSSEGSTYHSMKNVMEFMKKDDNNYSMKDIDNCKTFLKTVVQYAARKYEWDDAQNESVPAGWKVRSCGEGDKDSEQILSPDGIAYRSRYVAILALFKNRSDVTVIEEMKLKMIKHEKWEISSYLPPGWIFKVIWEGWSKDRKFQQSIHYLSSEGLPFESMKSAMEYMSSSNRYNEQNISKCKEFLKSRSNSDKSYDWSDGDHTILPGWKMRVCETESQRQYFLSSEGIQYRSRYVAYQDMFKRNYKRKDIEDMKKLLIEYDSWEISDFLPRGWLFKVICEGYTKDNKWYSNIHYISDDGKTFESMKTVTDHMAGSTLYTAEDISKCKEFMKWQKDPSKKYDWINGDETIPRNWKMRVSETENKWQFFLSPDGKQYRTRYVAILDMFARGCPEEEIEDMKESMINYEGWKRSEYLPFGWMYKICWEGFLKDGEKSQNIRYLSREGKPYESLKNVLEFMSSKPYYTYEDSEKCKDFAKILNCPEKKYKWVPGDKSLPPNWKMRVCETESKMKFFLSPEGIQYRSRYVAYQDMCKRNYGRDQIDFMKNLLIEYESWETNDLLPRGWLCKVIWEGYTKDNKWSSNVHYMSDDGKTFESIKAVTEFMKKSPMYSEEDVSKCKEFLKNQKEPSKKYDWNDGDDSLPANWKMRVSGGDAEMEWILSPEGIMYRSRVIALQDMIKRELPEDIVEEMRGKLLHEGWVTDPLFPEKWLIKKWEGKKRSKTGKLDQDLKFLTREGHRLESFKTVIEHLEAYKYGDEAISNVRAFKEQWSVSVRRGGFDWEECSISLPPGWQKRRGQGKTESEHILSPEGVQFRSRYSALLHLHKQGARAEVIRDMRSKLSFEGWETHALLPSNWLYKRTWEGVISNGSFSTNTIYLSTEGKVFESNKTAIDFMMATKDYNEDNVKKMKEFQVNLSKETAKRRDDWEANESVPAGWKVRTSTGSSGREYILRPDGRQYMSRVNALQHLLKQGCSQADIAAMKDKLGFEGWQSDEHLPPGWLYKVVSEGFTKDNKWYNVISFLSKDGDLLDNMKHVLEHMENHEEYTDRDVENCKMFQEIQSCPEKRYDWLPNDGSLPDGWRRRVSDGEAKMEWILSPEGKQYRSRFVAIQDMIKKQYPDNTVKKMRELMINHENWSRSEFLPEDWLFKIMCEGVTKDNKWYNTIFYLSREGNALESMKNVQDYMEKRKEYSKKDIDNCKLFLELHKSHDKKYEWNDGDETIPKNWKMRTSETEHKWQFFLSPEGKQYRSRYVAIQDMIKKNYSSQSIDEMRELMINHENWKRSEYLPHNWLYKVNWEGQTHRGKWSDNLVYLSRDGVTFESNKAAVEHMRESAEYDEEDEARCREFVKRRNQETQEVRFQWGPGDETVPRGWRMRRTGGREYILSPEGLQYMSRVVALTDMVKRRCSEADIEQMRSKLKYEGWNTNSYLPKGWFWKMWEGETRRQGDKQKFERNLFFVSREGVRLESFKAVIEFMEENKEYTKKDIEKINKYKKAQGVELRRKTYDWEEGGASLPAGWKKRSGKTQDGQQQERILSPDGEQFRSRSSALQSMVRAGAPRAEVEAMRQLLVHEGYQASELLPPSWLFKRVWEGTDASGRTASNTQYIAETGEMFESVKSAIEYLNISRPGGVEKLIANFKQFQADLSKTSREKREDWVVDDTVPKGWRRRVHESGKEYLLSPAGAQFSTRCAALLHLHAAKPSSPEVAAMKAKLCHEGWKTAPLLPRGWVSKIGESKLNGKVQRSYKFLSRECAIFESHKLALEFMETIGHYSTKEVEDFKKFFKKESSVGKRPRVQWDINSELVPAGWKTRVNESGCRVFLMPDGHQFESLLAALRHMVANDYIQSQVNTLRGFLKSEGWEYDSLLPMGWQIKFVTERQSLFLGRHGEYFDSTEKAVKFIAGSREYSVEDLQRLKTKFENKVSQSQTEQKSKTEVLSTPGGKKQKQDIPNSPKPARKRKSDSDLLNSQKRLKSNSINRGV